MLPERELLSVNLTFPELGVSDVHSRGLLTQINPGAQRFDCVVAVPGQKYTYLILPLKIGGFYIEY